MKNKKSLLIYKKLDNSITDKEQKLLNKYLEKNQEFQEEYKLINSISEELKNSTKKDLPADFNVKLREKLVNYNLNKDSDSRKRKFFPVTTMATLVTAVFLVVFAFNNTEILKSNVINENTDVTSEYKTEEPVKADNSKQRITNFTSDNTDDVSEKNIIKSKSLEKAQIPDAQNTPSVASEEILIKNENITQYNSAINDKNESTDGDNISSGGGGGNSGVKLSSSDYSEYIVLKTNYDISLLKDIKIESLAYNTFKISMDDFENIKQIIKDIPFEIQNENEENLKKEYFILINE